jgi:hypothetical protein
VPEAPFSVGLNLANLKELSPMTDAAERERLRERAAKNQSLFREVNERIGDLARDASFSTFICECLDETCTEGISLTLEEYEHIRRDSNSFFVLHGHDVAEVEEIRERTDRYIVVSKIGAGAVVAERLDPRRRASA